MLTLKEADEIWALLVKTVGVSAHPYDRDSFLIWGTSGRPLTAEFRLQGDLGFGGKLYITAERWYVACYPEDLTPLRERLIGTVNGALAELRGRLRSAADA